MKRKNYQYQSRIVLASFLLIFIFTCNAQAAKLVSVTILDKDYLIVNISDGDVIHQTESPKVDLADRYLPELNTSAAVQKTNWTLTSTDDSHYGGTGVNPSSCYRKKKLSGHAELGWGSGDWNYEYTYEHWIYLELPASLQQGATYQLSIGSSVNSDTSNVSFTYDQFSNVSEAIHINLAGYNPVEPHKGADLYYWMGNGGARNYSSFVGNAVYLYNVNSGNYSQVGTVQFWMASGSDVHGVNLTGSDVWNVDFSSASTPGTYRLVVEGVGCSQDFEIADTVYHDPFGVSVRGYYYMRMGERNPTMYPPPRSPVYIPGDDNTIVSLTDMHPFHPQWNSVSGGDKWDAPNGWAPYATGGTNPNGWGGHSDAADEDRHLAHVINIYSMLLPYIVSQGALSDDDVGITESGNGIPDVIDEARWEVDFWLRLRDGNGYSHGLTNSRDIANGYVEFFQAGTTAIAAWANAANAAMLADAFRIAGFPSLMNHYKDAAIEAYNVASSYSDQMLSDALEFDEANFRGRDFKMTAAAFLYNVTGDTAYEDAVYAESSCANSASTIQMYGSSGLHQLYGVAAYLMTPQTVHYPTMYNNMKTQIISEAYSQEANRMNSRPSRRSTYNQPSYWRTSHFVERSIVAHAVADTQADKDYLYTSLALEAGYGLGRNPLNMIEMTTAHTPLASKRSVPESYTSGSYDNVPGVHPGHTPYMQIMDDWDSSMTMGSPSKLLANSYPTDVKNSWPRGETYYPTRWVWAHNEFTPRQTMKGNVALYGYLHSLASNGAPANPILSVSLDQVSGATGVVTSVPAGIDCGSDCSESYANGTSVMLTATPGADSVFIGWTGGCFGSDQTCQLDMNLNKLVGAKFEPAGLTYELKVSLTGTGTGSVSSQPAGIQCGADCNEAYLSGSTVTLTATPEGKSYFAGWSGACSGSGTCEVTIHSEKTVIAQFSSSNVDDFVIYDDALPSGWYDGSWNSTINLSGTSPARDGSNIVNASSVQGWAGFQPSKSLGSIDTSAYSALHFWIHGGSGSNKSIKVYFQLGSSAVGTGKIITVQAGMWTEYSIPIDEFGNPGDISTLTFQNFTDATIDGFSVDDIRLIGTESTSVTGVSISPPSGTINGGTLQLTATISPGDANNKAVTWNSSNTSIATVSQSGTVIGKAIGTTTITATSDENPLIKDYATINVLSPTVGKVMNIMPLGDSITEGFLYWDSEQGKVVFTPGAYRKKLWQNLENAGLECGVNFVGTLNNNPAPELDDPDHEGHSGWTTAQILSNIDNYMSATQPDIVMMHLGTNDIPDYVDEAPANLRGLIDHITEALPADGKLFVAKIIPMGGVGNPSSIAYNNMIEAAVIEKQNEGLPVYLVDAYSIWQNSFYHSDWTHPNQEGHNALGDFWFDVIKDDIQLPCGGVVIKPGDINGDGSVNLADAILGLKVLNNESATPVLAGDVNGNVKIGMEEVIYILQKSSSD